MAQGCARMQQIAEGAKQMTKAAILAAWVLGSGLSAEVLGYFLHRLLHSGKIAFLSRNHMKHHMVLYGPLQEQRSEKYLDATKNDVSLGNIGVEWLLPAALVLGGTLAAFHLLHVQLLYQVVFVATTLLWSFLMFSYLHDVMHIEGYWLAKNWMLKKWFLSARKLHEIHHRVLSDKGIMNRNFGIGFFFLDRLFGTLEEQDASFNEAGYRLAQERFKSIHT